MARADLPADRPAPRPRRPRRRELVDEGERFGSFTPWKNPAAVYAYTLALVGMIPFLGLVCGPIAVLLATIGWLRLRRNPDIRGDSYIRAGLVIGTLDFAVNVAGIACIGMGMGWW